MKPATVPICEVCWIEEQGPITPVRLAPEHRDTETCYRCWRQTRSGIYVRRLIETPNDERNDQ